MGNTTTTISVEDFETECKRRLIDTFDLMQLTGLRSREGVWKRVEAGTLPPPVVRRDRHVALWDRDAIPDRKE